MFKIARVSASRLRGPSFPVTVRPTRADVVGGAALQEIDRPRIHCSNADGARRSRGSAGVRPDGPGDVILPAPRRRLSERWAMLLFGARRGRVRGCRRSASSMPASSEKTRQKPAAAICCASGCHRYNSPSSMNTGTSMWSVAIRPSAIASTCCGASSRL